MPLAMLAFSKQNKLLGSTEELCPFPPVLWKHYILSLRAETVTLGRSKDVSILSVTVRLSTNSERV